MPPLPVLELEVVDDAGDEELCATAAAFADAAPAVAALEPEAPEPPAVTGGDPPRVPGDVTPLPGTTFGGVPRPPAPALPALVAAVVVVDKS